MNSDKAASLVVAGCGWLWSAVNLCVVKSQAAGTCVRVCRCAEVVQKSEACLVCLQGHVWCGQAAPGRAAVVRLVVEKGRFRERGGGCLRPTVPVAL